MNPELAARRERTDVGAPRHDSGFSIVEVVIAIALMGVVVVAILDAVRTSVIASSVSRDAAQVETVTVNAADRVNRATPTCEEVIDGRGGYTQYVVAAVRSHGWWTGEGEYLKAAKIDHYFYNPAVAGGWQEGVCPTDRLGTQIIQMVRITITSPDRKVNRTIEVVKSNV